MHIADGFHLLVNYTDSISNYLKSNIPNLTNIEVNNDSEKELIKKDSIKKLTQSQELKIQFI